MKLINQYLCSETGPQTRFCLRTAENRHPKALKKKKTGIMSASFGLFGPPQFNTLSSNMWSLLLAPPPGPIWILVSLCVSIELEQNEGTGVVNAQGVQIVCAYYWFVGMYVVPGWTWDAAGIGPRGRDSDTGHVGAGEEGQRVGHEDRSERGRTHPGWSPNGPQLAQVCTNTHAHLNNNKVDISNSVTGWNHTKKDPMPECYHS